MTDPLAPTDSFAGTDSLAGSFTPEPRPSGAQQWQSAIQEQRRNEMTKTSSADQVGWAFRQLKNFITGGVSEVLRNNGVAMPDWSNKASDLMQSEPVNAALGVMTPMKAGMAGAAAKAVPLSSTERASTAPRVSAGLRDEMRNLALTGKHSYREGSETAGELFARQMAWLRGEIDGPFPETLGDVAPKGKIDLRKPASEFMQSEPVNVKAGIAGAAAKAVPISSERIGTEVPRLGPDRQRQLIGSLYPEAAAAREERQMSTIARDTHELEKKHGVWLVKDAAERERMGLPPIPAAPPPEAGSASWLDTFREKTSK
jgi:hypothetical protein